MGTYGTPLLIIPVAAIKVILGIDSADLSHDDALEMAAPIITRYFENYCGRGLAYAADVVEEVDIEPRLPLHRYPLADVTAYVIDGAAQAIPTFEAERGMVYSGYFCSSKRASVTYSGGYPQDDCPPDLAHAYAHCCADFIGFKPTTAGGGAITGQGAAPLKTLSLGSGALAIGFETKAEIKDTFDTSDAPVILQPYVFALRTYFSQYR